MYKQSVISESGFLTVSISFTNAHNNVIKIKKSYTNMDDADRCIEQHMRNWMADKLRRYVQHSDRLYETGFSDFYRTINKTAALEHCLRILPQLGDISLSYIATLILATEKQLTLILPSPKNNSYASSYRNLQELVWMSIQLRKVQRVEKQTA